MGVTGLQKGVDSAAAGAEMYELIRELYPICRSITGNGVRETLQRLRRLVPLEVHEVPSGTEVFDWTIPKEWNIKDAYIKDANGNKVVDFQRSNLHVVSYSIPVHRRVPLAELQEHLFTLPAHPDWIPYRTSYYSETWGFCLAHSDYLRLSEGEYEVFIDSALKDGHLTYGEFLVRGRTPDEVLIFTHICHPSLCNDNLSGIALSAYLAKMLAGRRLRYSYRFVFAPATIGSIAWLSRNERNLPKIRHGLVAAVVGDAGGLTYKRSRYANAEIDVAVTHVLKHLGRPYEVLDFTPYGYDERQFGSPGINLPVGRLTRSPNGCYPEYHTSADNIDVVKAEFLGDSLDVYLRVIEILESNGKYVNLNPKCEPQLGKRGLYRKMGGYQDISGYQWALLWVLNLSCGRHTLLDIAERAGLPFDLVASAARDLQGSGLLQPCDASD